MFLIIFPKLIFKKKQINYHFVFYTECACVLYSSFLCHIDYVFIIIIATPKYLYYLLNTENTLHYIALLNIISNYFLGNQIFTFIVIERFNYFYCNSIYFVTTLFIWCKHLFVVNNCSQNGKFVC